MFALERLVLGEGSSVAGDFNVVVAVASSPVAAASTDTRTNVALLAALVLRLSVTIELQAVPTI